MTAILLREIFADLKASAQASIETRTVSEASVLMAEQYIRLANQNLVTAKEAAAENKSGPSERPKK